MKQGTRQFGIFLASLMLVAGSCFAQAQSYPSRTISIVSPYPASSAGVVLFRLLAEELQKRLNQPVIVEAKPGAGGLIAMQAVVAAPADGYTLLGHATASTANVVFAKSPGVDPEKDFITISAEAYTPYFLVISSGVPANSMKEFVAYAKANPGKMNIAVHPNSWANLSALEILNKFGISMTLVPYDGGVRARQALLANEVQAYPAPTLFGMTDFFKDGKLKVLAVLDNKRFPLFPDIPTLREETGIEMSNTSYLGTQVRAGTPQPVVDKLSGTLKEIFADPAIKGKYENAGFSVGLQGPAEASTTFARAYGHAREVARAAGLPRP